MVLSWSWLCLPVQGELLGMFCVSWLEAKTVDWSLTVSAQEKEDLGGRARPKYWIDKNSSHILLRIPARTPVICKLSVSFPEALKSQMIPFKHPSWLCKNQRSSSNHEQPHAPFHQHPKVTSHSQSSLATLNSLVSLRPEHLSGVKHRQKSCVEWHMQQGSSDTASSLLCVLCTWTSSCFLCLCSMPGLRKLIPWQGCFWPAFRDTEAAWKS